MRRVVMMIVGVVSMTGILHADEITQEDRVQRIVEQIDAKLESTHTPGMSIAVVQDDEVILLRGFGVTSLETKQPVTPDTRFAIGSTTKAFTATIVGMLVDEGVMDWDDRVSEHLDWHLCDAEADAQLNMSDIMSHRTGLASMTLLWYGNDLTPEEVLATASRAELLYPFREKWNYSNICFLAAGWASAAAEDTDWHTQLHERILKPLGMRDTNSTIAAAIADPLMSKGYMWDEEKSEYDLQEYRSVDAVAPAGSINSSARDMAKWIRMLLNKGTLDGHRLISEAAIDETWSPHSTVGGDVEYGLGWMIRDWEGRRVIEHTGGIDGFSAQVAIIPDEHIGLVVLTNRLGTPIAELSRAIVFESLLTDWSGSEEAPGSDENFERFVGNYIGNFGPFKDATFEVLVQNGNLAIDVPGQMIFEMNAPDEDGKRAFQGFPIAVRFNENDEGDVIGLEIHQGGMTFELPREGIEAAPEVELADVRPYIGKYHFEALNNDVEVRIDRGRLAVDIPGQMVCQLHLPDEEGRWLYRINEQIWVSFNEKAGNVTSMTLVDRGETFELPRVGDAPGMPELPSAAELVRAVSKARGTETGVDADVISYTGKARMVHMGVTANVRLIATADGRLVNSIDFGRFGHVRTVVNGKEGFLDASMMDEPMELEGQMLDQVWLDSPFVWLADWRDEFDVLVVNETTFDEIDVYEVRLERKDLPPVTTWVDRATWLPVATRLNNVNPLGMTVEVTTTLEDYRDVKGYMMPHRITVSNDLSGDFVIDVTQYEIDPSLDASAFARP